MFWTKKNKPEPKPKLKRIVVHLTGGLGRATHYAERWVVHKEYLYIGSWNGIAVATYASGSYWSVTTGKRSLS